MKDQKYQQNLIIILGLAGLFFLIVVYFANLQLAGWQGVGKDFFSHWTNTRTFLVNGYSPYKQQALFEVEQQAVLKNLTFGEAFDYDIEPLYSLLVYIPFVLIPSFQHALAAWLVLNEILILFIFWLLFRLTSWQGKRILFVFVCVSVLAWKPLLQALFSGSSSIFLLLILISVLYTMKHGMHELAGVLLAVSTIRIDFLWFGIFFLLLYALISKKQKIAAWFFVTILLVSVSLMLLDPLWVRDYFIAALARMVNYPHSIFKAATFSDLINLSYFSPLSQAFESTFLVFGVRLGNLITVLMLGFLGLEWAFMAKRDDKGVLWIFCLTILISTWIGLNEKNELYLFYIPCLYLFLSLFFDRWKSRGKGIYWIVPLVFLGLSWLKFPTSSLSLWMKFVFYPGSFLILLYWIRWWALSKNYLVYEGKYK